MRAGRRHVQDDKGSRRRRHVTLVAVGTRREDLFNVAGTDTTPFQDCGHRSRQLPGVRLGRGGGRVRRAVGPDYVKPFEASGQSVQISEAAGRT